MHPAQSQTMRGGNGTQIGSRALMFEGLSRNAQHYRPEIDGLRAIAVVSVMLYHARIPGFSGGFSGVDVFFVISGYLISGIILRETADGSFAFASFYARRARRILPALFAVLLASTLAAWIILFPDAMERFGQSLLASLAFGANIFFWRMSDDYFAPASDQDPLLHLWSLSVEEQFYLLYPLLLVLLARRRRLLLPALAVAAVGSLLLSEGLSHLRPGVNFYMLPTRGWEFLAGALLAVREASPRKGIYLSGRGLRKVAGLVGLGLVVAPVFLLDRADPFPGLLAVPTVAGTAMLIAFAGRDTLVGSLLAGRGMVAAGLLSYGAYLWHQPLLALARAAAISDIAIATSLILLCAAFGLAALTWLLVERPFRRKGTVSTGRTLSAAALAIGLLMSAGAAAWVGKGVPQRYAPETRALVDSFQQYIAAHDRCLSWGPSRPFDQACTSGTAGPVTLAIVGDSHAEVVAAAFVPELNRRGERAIRLVSAGCPPILRNDGMSVQRRTCAAFHNRVFAYLKSRKDIGTVVFAARWQYHMEHTPFDNGEGGAERMDPESAATPATRAAMGESFRQAVLAMLAMGKRVVLVYPVPEAGWNVPVYVAKARRYGFWMTTPTTSYAAFAARTRDVYRALDALGERGGLFRLYPARRLCPRGAARRCIVTRNGKPLYYDDDHLNPEGAEFALPDVRVAFPR